jgi:hypothetical protein
MSVFDEIEAKLANINKVAPEIGIQDEKYFTKTASYDEKDPEHFLENMTNYDDEHSNQLIGFTKTPQFKIYAQKFKDLFGIDLLSYYKKAIDREIKVEKEYGDDKYIIQLGTPVEVKQYIQSAIKLFDKFLSQF